MPPPSSHFPDLPSLQLAYDRLLHQAEHRAAFLGTASHELRAPINQIISLHQLVLEDLCENPAEEREFIAQANQTMHQVLKYLDLLITLSKLDIGTTQPRLEPTLLAPLLNRVQQLVEMQCVNRHCRLTLGSVDSEYLVNTDGSWLEQTLVMLIEASLAQGSTQIALTVAEADGVGGDRLLLDLASTPGELPDPPVPLSAEFRHQLATRLLAHLGISLAVVTAEQPYGHLRLGVPVADL